MSLGAREREIMGNVDPRQFGKLEAWYDAEYIEGFGENSPNLLTNSSFDNIIDPFIDWDINNCSVIPGRTGGNAMRLDYHWYGWIARNVAFLPVGVYTFSAWLRCNNLTSSGYGILIEGPVEVISMTNLQTASGLTTDWVRVYETFRVVTPGLGQCILTNQYGGTDVIGTIDFDDAQIEVGSVMTPYRRKNGEPLADGQLISQWNDLSGNNRHVFQATPANQPFYRVPRAAGVVNLVPNPRCKDNVNGWDSNNPAAWSVIRDAANPHRYEASAKFTFVGSEGDRFASALLGTPWSSPIVTTVGKAYHVSVWVKASRNATCNLYMLPFTPGFVPVPFVSPPVSALYGTYTEPGGMSMGPDVVLAANTWTKLDLVTGPIPVGADFLSPVINAMATPSGTVANGDTLWITELLVEEWPSNSQYVDGDAGGDYAWESTPHLSPTKRLTSDPERVQFDGFDDMVVNSYGDKEIAYLDRSPLTFYTVLTDLKPGGVSYVPLVQHYGHYSLFNIQGNVAFLYNNDDASSQGRTFSFGGKHVLSVISSGVISNTIVDSDVGTQLAYLAGYLHGTVSIGAAGASPNGSVLAVLIFSEAHDEAKRHRVEQWLAARYKIPITRP